MEDLTHIVIDLYKGLGMNRIAELGEEREWGGIKYKKIAPGHWKQVDGNHEVKIKHHNTEPTRHGFGMYRSGASMEMGVEDKHHIASIEQTKGGLAHGVQREYYPNGRVKSEIHYKDGKKEGDYIAYYESGKLKGMATYKNDKLEGKVQQFEDVKQRGVSHSIPHMGLFKEENYVNGKKHGESKTYSQGQLYKVENYKDGKKHMHQTEYDTRTGLRAKVEEYREGKLHGPTHYFDSQTGQKEKTENYHEGRLAGKMTLYHKGSGRVMEERNYNTNSELHGTRTEYDVETGKKRRENNYQYGKLHGEDKWYNKKGEVEHTTNWKNGVPQK